MALHFGTGIKVGHRWIGTLAYRENIRSIDEAVLAQSCIKALAGLGSGMSGSEPNLDDGSTSEFSGQWIDAWSIDSDNEDDSNRFQTTQIMGFFAHICGGYRNLNFISKDLYNYMDGIRQSRIMEGDAAAAIRYLKGNAELDPMAVVVLILR
ncbi:hypothetical protein AHAS_Ahas20G0277600 [Arachis hypogaea]